MNGIARVLNKKAVGVPAGAVYIGRGTRFGNPFRIGEAGDRATVIAKHEAWLKTQDDIHERLDALRGRDLVCFCAPLGCHGDLYLKLSRMTREEVEAWRRS